LLVSFTSHHGNDRFATKQDEGKKTGEKNSKTGGQQRQQAQEIRSARSKKKTN
jgi:hypothetical protein